MESSRFLLAALAAVGVGGAYLCMLFAAPILLSDHGWGAGLVGLLLLPAGVLGAISARLAGALIATQDPFRVVAAFALASSLGLALPALLGPSPVWVVVGLGLAVSGFTASQVALLDAGPALVPDEVRSTATGLLVLMFLLGGAMGSAATAGLATTVSLPAATAWLVLLPASATVIAPIAQRRPWRRVLVIGVVSVVAVVLAPFAMAGIALRVQYVGEPDPRAHTRGHDAVWLGHA